LSPESEIPDTTQEGETWNFSQTGSRIIVEVATAYAITKVLLPLRLMFSVWLTPWFARVWVRGISGRLTALGQRWRTKPPIIHPEELVTGITKAGTVTTRKGVTIVDKKPK